MKEQIWLVLIHSRLHKIYSFYEEQKSTHIPLFYMKKGRPLAYNRL